MYQSAFRKWFLLSAVLVCVHGALVMLIALMVATTRDPEGGMLWYLAYMVDYPASRLVDGVISDTNSMTCFLLVGTPYWGLIGLVPQSAWRGFAWALRR